MGAFYSMKWDLEKLVQFPLNTTIPTMFLIIIIVQTLAALQVYIELFSTDPILIVCSDKSIAKQWSSETRKFLQNVNYYLCIQSFVCVIPVTISPFHLHLYRSFLKWTRSLKISLSLPPTLNSLPIIANNTSNTNEEL